ASAAEIPMCRTAARRTRACRSPQSLLAVKSAQLAAPAGERLERDSPGRPRIASPRADESRPRQGLLLYNMTWFADRTPENADVPLRGWLVQHFPDEARWSPHH